MFRRIEKNLSQREIELMSDDKPHKIRRCKMSNCLVKEKLARADSFGHIHERETEKERRRYVITLDNHGNERGNHLTTRRGHVA